jgi:hypothetical protein
VSHEIHAAVHDVEASGLDSVIDRVVAEAGGAKLPAGGDPVLPAREPRGRINPVNVALDVFARVGATLAGIVPVNVALSARAGVRATLAGMGATLA